MSSREIHAAAARILNLAEIDWRALETGAGAADPAAVAGLKLLCGVTQRFSRAALNAPTANESSLFRFDRLEVGDLLGKGTTAEVYRAYDPLLDRHVALKLRSTTSDMLAHQFIAEGRRLARIRHPHVVAVHGAAIEGERVGIWMELVPGAALEDRIVAGPMPVTDVVDIGMALCSALAAAHACGIVHGDVKPQNVMVESPGGRIVLTDFGASCEIDAPATLVVHGTLSYLAPEVIRGALPSPRSDVYSVGVLLFLALTGKLPYIGNDVDAISAAHDKGPCNSLRSLRSDLPLDLVAAVESALELDRTRRPQTARALATLLVAS